ncbi:hypothetical protein CEXT_646691 [Caerostris extrusa]|uniref:Uncharacterized protein n=1 Tax=Caerostris extrusa TaxID=172846 RepID=A0AAV4R0K2_CAEEX|nr:hypothetical protein CEXT_646691 [Caerostris extrusa]
MLREVPFSIKKYTAKRKPQSMLLKFFTPTPSPLDPSSRLMTHRTFKSKYTHVIVSTEDQNAKDHYEPH